MSDDRKRIKDQPLDTALSPGDLIIVDSEESGVGTRKFDLGQKLVDIDDDFTDVRADFNNLSLGINPEDDLIYIYFNGIPIGDGIEGGGGTGTRYNVSWSLSNATSTSHIASIAEGKPLNATLTANDSLVLTTVQITMGGLDITESVYTPSTGRISITSVTGNVVIIAKATDGIVVFSADFSGEHPLASQFYTWEGRDYSGRIYDALSNIECVDGIVDLTSIYDSTRSRWIEQMLSTGGLFESDNFILTFKAKFDGTAGSWNNIITYGSGTHWTNSTYSDGIKWPAGGEIDAFEQAGGYSENPNTFHPVFHYGAGTNSSFPNHHSAQHMTSNALPLPIDEWAEFRFVLNNGVVTLSVNGTQVAQNDGSDLTVNNEYLWDYHPFLKPQAFYIACGNAGGSSDVSDEFHFYVKDFDIVTESKQNTPCTALSIYPQMWGSNAIGLVFPTNAEIYFDRTYTPANTSNKACVWESSNPSVATVCQGYVKTLSEGSCTITARCGNATATYTLTVSNSLTNVPCAGVVADTDALQIVGTSSTDLSSFIYKYPKFTTDSVQLVSSDETIVTVSGTTITGTGKEGTANITVKCGNSNTVTIPVTVSSGIILDTDLPAYSSSTKTVMSDYPAYDSTQTYSFQYTFGENNVSRGSTTPNIYVGPSQSNSGMQNGAIQFYGGSQTWVILRGGSTVSFTPSVDDVLTIVINMATNKMNAYLNDTQLITNGTAGYMNATTQVISKENNDGATVAPTHIKIAIGDLHPTA